MHYTAIEIKSLGFLIDEAITAEFKLEVAEDKAPVENRIEQLKTAIARRIFNLDLSDEEYREIQEQVEELRKVLRACWDAQEIVRFSHTHTQRNVAKAGITAQDTNATRNKIIRMIDHIAKEESVLSKTYGE